MTPRAVTDNKELALAGVRAKGSVPRFHFVLADGPRQLLAEVNAVVPQQPGRHDLSAENHSWSVRIYMVLCDPDLSCTTPKDWLSVAEGDELAGWVELNSANNAALCVAAIRGAGHPPPSSLPCTTMLYSPAIPID